MNPFVSFRDFGLLQSGDLGVRTASNGNENSFKDLLGRSPSLGLNSTRECRQLLLFSPATVVFSMMDAKIFSIRFASGFHQVAIGAGQQTWQHFDHGDLVPSEA